MVTEKQLFKARSLTMARLDDLQEKNKMRRLEEGHSAAHATDTSAENEDEKLTNSVPRSVRTSTSPFPFYVLLFVKPRVVFA